MPKDIDPQQFGELYGTVVAMREDMNSIKKYMEQGVILRVQSVEELTKIKGHIIEFQNYQKKCDTDREDQGERINSLESSRNYVRGALGVIVVLLGYLGYK